MINLLDACKMARDWFDKMTNDEPVWEEQPSADMATIMVEAIQTTPPDPQHGREPCETCKGSKQILASGCCGMVHKYIPCPDCQKLKPLAQFLSKYVEHETELELMETLSGLVSWRELLEQALDAYESIEQVKVRIERV